MEKKRTILLGYGQCLQFGAKSPALSDKTLQLLLKDSLVTTLDNCIDIKPDHVIDVGQEKWPFKDATIDVIVDHVGFCPFYCWTLHFWEQVLRVLKMGGSYVTKNVHSIGFSLAKSAKLVDGEGFVEYLHVHEYKTGDRLVKVVKKKKEQKENVVSHPR